MNNTLDDFSRNLAGGMSRRKAFMKFLAGAGALGFLGSRTAKAGNAVPPSECPARCLTVAATTYQHCLNHEGTTEACYDRLMRTYQCCLRACEDHGVPSACMSDGQ